MVALNAVTEETLNLSKGKIIVMDLEGNKDYRTILGRLNKNDYGVILRIPPDKSYQLTFDALLPYERSALLPLEMALLPIGQSLNLLRKLPLRRRDTAQKLLLSIEKSANYFELVRNGTYTLDVEDIKSIEFAEAMKDYVINMLVNDLPESLSYHIAARTLDVFETTRKLVASEKLPFYEAEMVQLGALFEDTGIIKGYKKFKKRSTEITEETMRRFGYNETEIKTVNEMILATNMPQNPQSAAQKVLCDATLDLLGRNNFVANSQLLRKEWELFLGKKFTKKEWFEYEIDFLKNHKYFTESENSARSTGKIQNIEKLEQELAKIS